MGKFVKPYICKLQRPEKNNTSNRIIKRLKNYYPDVYFCKQR